MTDKLKVGWSREYEKNYSKIRSKMEKVFPVWIDYPQYYSKRIEVETMFLKKGTAKKKLDIMVECYVNLSDAERHEYQKQFPEPNNMKGFYNFIEKNLDRLRKKYEKKPK